MNLNRREFFKLGLASSAAVSMAACGRPVEHGLVSQYTMPEYKIPGRPLFWASACVEGRSDCAVAVKTVNGRAIHVMGMPGHPVNNGAVDVHAVSAPQALYHPDRWTASERFDGEGSSVTSLAKAMAKEGKQKLIVVDRIQGTRGSLIADIARKAQAKVWCLDAHESLVERRIMQALAGKGELPYYPIEDADFLLTFNSDFLHRGYSSVRDSKAYGHFRKGNATRGGMVSISPRMTATCANADVWLPNKPGSEGVVAVALGKYVAGKKGGSYEATGDYDLLKASEISGISLKDLEHLGNKLAAAKNPVVVAGCPKSIGADACYAVHALNKLVRSSLETFEPDLLVRGSSLSADMLLTTEKVFAKKGSWDTIMVLGCDPAYQLPQDYDFSSLLAEKRAKAYFVSSFGSDSFTICGDNAVKVPVRTWLENWGDLAWRSPGAKAYSIQQPTVRTAYDNSLSPMLENDGVYSFDTLDVLLEVAKSVGATNYTAFTSARDLIQRDSKGEVWENLLIRGGVWKATNKDLYPHPSAQPPVPVAAKASMPSLADPFSGLAPYKPAKIEFSGQTDSSVAYVFQTAMEDGRYGHMGWFQELPDAMTTIVWDSWIELNEQVAKKLGVRRHDVIKVTIGDKEIVASAYPTPALHPEAVGLPSGRGQLSGQYAKIGFNPNHFLQGVVEKETGAVKGEASGLTIEKMGHSERLTTFDKRVFDLPRHILPE